MSCSVDLVSIQERQYTGLHYSFSLVCMTLISILRYTNTLSSIVLDTIEHHVLEYCHLLLVHTCPRRSGDDNKYLSHHTIHRSTVLAPVHTYPASFRSQNPFEACLMAQKECPFHALSTQSKQMDSPGIFAINHDSDHPLLSHIKAISSTDDDDDDDKQWAFLVNSINTSHGWFMFHHRSG